MHPFLPTNSHTSIFIIAAISSILFGWLVDRLRPGMVMALQMSALIVTMIMATMMTSQILLIVYALSFGFLIGGGGVFDLLLFVFIETYGFLFLYADLSLSTISLT